MKQSVREGFELFGFSIGWLVAVVLAVAVLSGVSFGLYAFFQPRYVGVQNQTFHQSQAYNDGMVSQLQAYEVQYQSASPAGKESIRSVIRQQYANFPEDKLSPDLRGFLDTMKGI